MEWTAHSGDEGMNISVSAVLVNQIIEHRHNSQWYRKGAMIVDRRYYSIRVSKESPKESYLIRPDGKPQFFSVQYQLIEMALSRYPATVPYAPVEHRAALPYFTCNSGEFPALKGRWGEGWKWEQAIEYMKQSVRDGFVAALVLGELVK